MEFIRTTRSTRYLLALWLGLSLLLAQTLGIHLHLDHSHDAAVKNAHHVELHPGLISHADNADHHVGAIDIGPDTLVKNSTSIFSIAFIAFFSLLLIAPVLRQIRRHRFYQSIYIPFTCLLQPPLRAPPRI